MRIALDATYSLGQDLSGVGVYSRELLRELTSAHPEAELRFCYRPHRFWQSFRERLPRNGHRSLLWENRPPRCDLFHGLNQRLPRKPKRAVSTFHDLFVLTGDYSSAEFRRRFAEQARHAAAGSDIIIAVSEFTAEQVTELLGVPRSRIRVVHHGVRTAQYSELPREQVILHVGAIQKRKNIARLVEAFAQTPRPWRLALAGSRGYGASEILDQIGRSGCPDRIQLLGYLPAGVLAEWYARSSIFVFPSLDEGFGMPVLEAMAAGVPAIASNRSALPEVCGNAALLVNPMDTQALAAAICKLIEDKQLRKDLVARGFQRASLFTWSKTARETWEVYQELAG